MSTSLPVSAPSRRPPSATNNIINTIGLAMFFLTLWYCNQQRLHGVDAALLVTLAYAIPVLLLEVIFLRTPWRDSVGLDFNKLTPDAERIFIKLVGLYGSFGFVALLYWLFPEYHGSYYDPCRAVLELIWSSAFIYVVLLSAMYVFFMDSRMREPLDSYYWFGCCLLGRFRGVRFRLIVQHLLGWLVKGFFLPLMWVSFVGNINGLTFAPLNQFPNFDAFFEFAVSVLFTVDLLAAVAGYTLAIRLFDTHLRSTEPTLFGWIICLICYQPFQSVVMRFYLAYSSTSWTSWLADYPNIRIVWGSIMLLFLFVYTCASINFGCRFSNLTNRGILTKGMYRFTKHPAYVGKNIFWWMLYVPFIPANGEWEALRFCILLLGVNAVYFFRARTEERHLSRDPRYVEYGLWMNDHSIFRGLARHLPWLRYRPPQTAEPL
ncbi:MAG: DUF1295 domain-containing protein [Alphaproteobacteria bacterium]|nr:DUF1295 domain-containing protein [Alphaproteobacteria bacterium]